MGIDPAYFYVKRDKVTDSLSFSIYLNIDMIMYYISASR